MARFRMATLAFVCIAAFALVATVDGPPSRVRASGVASAAGEDVESRGEAEPESAQPPPVLASDPPFGGDGFARLRVEVTSSLEDGPVRHVRVDVVPFSDASGGRRRIGGVTDERGRVRFPRVPTGPAMVFAGHESRYTSVEAGGETVVAIALDHGIAVAGGVQDAMGAPVPGASIWISSPGCSDRGDVVAVTGADGSFSLPYVRPGAHLAVRAEGLAWAGLEQAPEGAGVAPMRFVVSEPPFAVRGSVVDEAGRPVAGAWVGCRRLCGRAPVVETIVSEDGAFLVEGLPAGEWTVEAWDERHASVIKRVTLGHGGAVEIALTLRSGATITGCVRDEHGRGVPRARVTAMAEGSIGPGAAATTGPDGSFRLDHVPGARILARVADVAGSAATARLDLTGSGSVAWDPILTRGRTLAGRVADERGADRAFARIRAASRDGRSVWMAETIADCLGRFEIGECPDGSFGVDVEVAGWGPAGLFHIPELRVGGAPVVLTVPEDARPTAFIAGMIARADGTPLAGSDIRAMRPGSTGGAPAVARSRAPDGSFRIGPLAPGRWIVDARSAAGARATLAERDLGRGEEADLGVCRIDREGFLRVLLEPGRGVTSSARLTVEDLASRPVAVLRPVDGFAASGPMSTGGYVLRLEGAGKRSGDRRFTIHAGETTTLRISGNDLVSEKEK